MTQVEVMEVRNRKQRLLTEKIYCLETLLNNRTVDDSQKELIKIELSKLVEELIKI